MSSPLRKVIALDFDGTLCENNYPNIGAVKSIHKVVHEYIRAEHKKGTVIILWTCRAGNELGDAVEFCMRNDIPIDYVNENDPDRVKLYGSDSRKISADMYIDDKAVDFNYLRETCTEEHCCFPDCTLVCGYNPDEPSTKDWHDSLKDREGWTEK